MMNRTWSPELEIPLERATPASASPRRPELPLQLHELPPYARADRPLARLVAELHRLSAHRDDATAVRALELYEQMRAAGPAMTAQAFERLYVQLLERRDAHGDPARREWLYAYRLSCDVFQALLWAWRLRVLESIAAGPRGDAAGPSRDGGEGRP